MWPINRTLNKQAQIIHEPGKIAYQCLKILLPQSKQNRLNNWEPEYPNRDDRKVNWTISVHLNRIPRKNKSKWNAGTQNKSNPK